MKIVKYLLMMSIAVVIASILINAKSYPGYVQIPKIYNINVSEAIRILTDNNLQYDIVYEDSNQKKDTIISVTYYGYKDDENYYVHPDKIVKLKVSNNDKVAYLTFDDGPTKYNTYRVLEILEKYDIKATFFFVGDFIQYYGEQVKAAYDAGHAIGCHSTTHKFNEIYASKDNFVSDIEEWESIAYKVIGKLDYKLYRYPGGSSTPKNYRAFDDISNSLDELGYTYFDWNMTNNDSWSKTKNGELSSLEYVKKTFTDQMNGYVKNSKIIVLLLHETYDCTVDTLEFMIETLIDNGYSFDTLDNY